MLTDHRVQEPTEDWYVSLVRHSSDLIVVVDEQGVVVYVNPAGSAMFGVPAQEAVGRSAFQYIHPDDRARVIVRQAELARSPGASMSDTLRFLSATDEVRVLEIVATNCLQTASVAGIVINGRDVTERNEYVTKLKTSFDAVTAAIANTVELRDPYTAGHQRQVAYIATQIARELGLAEEDVKGIEVASTLHDIGKIAIPAEILSRPGRLSAAEFEIVKTHPDAGYHIVADVSFPWPVAQMILQHHERLDGSGYPNGLVGDAILVGSRIVAVADVISAMTEHRPYRPALGFASAVSELENNSGRLYDPAIVDCCLRLFRDQQIPLKPDTAHGPFVS
ncbi:MAG: HD domain-containing phosphohydrolase [Acidimicrobiales bacterium]